MKSLVERMQEYCRAREQVGPDSACILSVQDLRKLLELADENAALMTLSRISSYLGSGMGEDSTTPDQFEGRIRWGVQHHIQANQSFGWKICQRAVLEVLERIASPNVVEKVKALEPVLPADMEKEQANP